MTATLAPSSTRLRPLPGDPQNLEPGAAVLVARPENDGPQFPANRKGQRGTVWAVHRHVYTPRGKRPAEPPRVLVWVSFADGRLAPKWADELDLID